MQTANSQPFWPPSQEGDPHAANVVDYAVNWFLGDVATWRHIREIWVHIIRDIDGTVIASRSIKPVLHPNGVEWRKTFQTVYAKYRLRLGAVVGNAEDARWTSYGLSYQALRGCAKLG